MVDAGKFGISCRWKCILGLVAVQTKLVVALDKMESLVYFLYFELMKFHRRASLEMCAY